MSPLSLIFLPLFSQSPIEAQLAEIEVNSKGKLGVAIITPTEKHYSRKHERFSLQSVMKLMVSMAALDMVDQGRWKPGQPFTFFQTDRSVSWQPFADKLGKRSSMPVTMEDCIEATVTESCSAAGDFLIRKMGGIEVVNAFLKKKGIQGLTVDRQERDLQTQIAGVTWKPEFVDEKKLDAAIAKLSSAARDAAYRRYQADPRDTTTPAAMGLLLEKLVTGKLLSPRSTKYLMGVMERTVTGVNRLKAGVPAGWILGHKTGTSSTHRGVSCATNDVGYARKSNGQWVIIVALLRNSTLSDDQRENVLCQVAQTALANR